MRLISILIPVLIISRFHISAQVTQSFVRVQASNKYDHPGLLKKLLFGSNYRKEWGTFVTIPIFDIGATNFKIEEMGGGQQTTSLELSDELGREWALRSLDKNYKPPKKIFDNKLVKTIVKEQISGSYPYAGLSIYDITAAAGIPVGKQYLFFVPDDSSFGKYSSAMANKVFLLVNRLLQKKEGISTKELLEKLKTDTQSYVDSKQYLIARLVDWLIADWDRHDDQWRWTERQTDSGVAFYVVPRDRDQAFYRANGLLIKIGSFFLPYMDRFNKTARGIKGLSKKARLLDKQFLNSLSREEWIETIEEFQKNVSDSVIETAIKRQPPEIFAIRGNEMIEKIISRRDGFLKHVMKYYSFLKR